MALAFGIPSVKRLKGMIDTGEFYDWFAFLESEPIGPFKENVQMARLIAMTANAYGDRKSAPKDFLPAMVGIKTPGRSDDEIADAFRGLAKAKGGV